MKTLIQLILISMFLVSCASTRHYTGKPELVSAEDKVFIEKSFDLFEKDLNYTSEYKEGFRGIAVTMDYYNGVVGRGFCKLSKDLDEAELVINKTFWDRTISENERYKTISHGLSLCISNKRDSNTVYKLYY